MIYKFLLRPILFSFDSEKIHDFVLNYLSKNYRWLKLLTFKYEHEALHQKLFGLDFRSPVGLAAGFDKFAKAVHAWQYLGFGFAEIGTITGQPQQGNEKPRLFRLKKDHALINRLGFNNDGAVKTAETLEHEFKMKSGQKIPIGINLGKTKIIETEKAFEDYLFSFQRLWNYADYFVLNVSSPNTPNLRELQEKRFLIQILMALTAANQTLAKQNAANVKPIFVKIAPDLSWEQIDQIIGVALESGIQGIVATNTTVQRNGLKSSDSLVGQPGGLSGCPLAQRSTEIIRHIYKSTKGKLTIIGVGGIFTGDDAYAKITAGASLIQVYTGFIYEGPMICKKINKRLVQRLHKDGFQNITQAIGQQL